MAKKFSFRLERFLNIKSMRVSELKEELNKLISLRNENESKTKQKELYLDEISRRKKGKTKVENLQTQLAHKDFTNGEIIMLKKENKRLLEIESVKRKELTEAMKEEKILLKLKEKKKKQHLYELNLEETKILDEIASKIYQKNQNMN